MPIGHLDTVLQHYKGTGKQYRGPAYSNTGYSDTVRRGLLTVTLFQIPD